MQRAMFLAAGDGTIACVWIKMKPEGHAEEVFEPVRALGVPALLWLSICLLGHRLCRLDAVLGEHPKTRV